MSLLHDPTPSTSNIAAFVVLVLVVAAAAVSGVALASQRAGEDEATTMRRRVRMAAVLTAWLAVTALVAASGALARFDVTPPPFLLFVAATAVASTAFAFSATGTLLARDLPLAALVGFQAFRVPLEIILHRLSYDRVLPVQMTFDGMNWDILSGLTAALVALWAAFGRVPRLVLAAWNLLGLALLFVIVAIAILSAPVPFRVFVNEPANTIVATVPFVWLPTVLVQAAWIGHLLVLRRLRSLRGLHGAGRAEPAIEAAAD